MPATRGRFEHVLGGSDPPDGIVAIQADKQGRARIWRRDGTGTHETLVRFPNWFLTTTLELLAHLPISRVSAAELRDSRAHLEPGRTTVVELDSATPDLDAYRFLVLADDMEEMETVLLETWNKTNGGEAESLAGLNGLVLVWPPVEQYLMLSGRTMFTGLEFDEVNRLQFDLETTGLDEDRDRIFMVSMRDSRGWRTCLDTRTMSEADLIMRFVEWVKERDPDVLENHNIFAFDLPFLVKRATRLGVRLAIGRDGSDPRMERGTFDIGDRAEPFVRWSIAGRQVIDTQHAVRRFGASEPRMRRHGLKDAARYFGFATADREYVPGAEVWPVYQSDPERIRRYAEDDATEVDGLSRRLMPGVFDLCRILPRAYESLASDTSPTSLWEPLMVRAYLKSGRAIPAPVRRQQQIETRRATESFLTGVVGAGTRARLPSLLPSVIAEHVIRAANDELSILPSILRGLRRASAPRSALLEEAAPSYLASQGLFSDPAAAARAAGLARRYVERLCMDLEARGCSVIEMDSDQVLVATPEMWSTGVQDAIRQHTSSYLPTGVQLTFDEPYAVIYARAAQNAMFMAGDGSVTLVGNTLRSGRMERFGESFVRRVAGLALSGDILGVRQVFLDTLYALQTAQVALEDLCLRVTLHKGPYEYRRAGTREEPYEALLDAGIRSWRPGQRIGYFRSASGAPRLYGEGGDVSALEADTAYYVRRLTGLYCQQFAQAFRPEDYGRVFGVPSQPGPWSAEPELVAVRTIVTRSAARV